MKEDLLQYVWLHKLFDDDNFYTIDGEKIEIIDYGTLNTNAGPDFFNAKIKIKDILWVGNVEIHNSASDWQKHSHNSDPHYDNVILHVVTVFDYQAFRQNGEPIKTAVLTLNNALKNKFERLSDPHSQIKCADFLDELNPDFVKLQLSKLLNDRLFAKSQIINEWLVQMNNNWEHVLFVSLATTLGMCINAMPFEKLAKSFCFRDLQKHCDDILQIEAFLFGQAGLLHEVIDNDYYCLLQREYNFLKNKFSLTPIDPNLWIYARMRPVNFPHIRIAELAAILHKNEHLFSKIIESKNPKDISKLFMTPTSSFWKNHYTFKENSPEMVKRIGSSTADVIVINTIVPMLFAYAQKRNLLTYEELAFSILENLKPEKNNITTLWNKLGLKAKSAYDSQALIELKKKYCNSNNCLRCAFAHKILCKKSTLKPNDDNHFSMAEILSKVEREIE